MESRWRITLRNVPVLAKYLMVIGTIIFISFLFPNYIKFRYHYSLNGRWDYPSLEAPYDFAVVKSAEELKKEKQAARRDLPPFYEIDNELGHQQLKSFEENFYRHLQDAAVKAQFPKVVAQSDRYLAYGKGFLQRRFKNGIIQVNADHAERDQDYVVRVVRGNTTYEQTLDNLTTMVDVRRMITDSLPTAPLAEPDFLLPLLEDALTPNLTYNASLTERYLDEQLSSIPTTRDKIERGDLIIYQGGRVDEDVFQKLESLRIRYEREATAGGSQWIVFVGYLLLTTLIIGAFVFYLRSHESTIFEHFNQLAFILLWLCLFSYLVYFVEHNKAFNAYMIPFIILPIVVNIFFDVKIALFTHIVVVLIASFMTSLDYEFTFLQMLAGIAVLLSNLNTRNWGSIFTSMFFVYLTYAVGFLGLSLIEGGSLRDLDISIFSSLAISVFLTLLAFPLVPLLERFFGFTSAISLVELSDLNRPLLTRMAVEAPGTLQHSLQVANLAETAAREIDADHLLVKVAALYHDIGKMKHPEYFIENQSGVSPHESISALESAQIILEHVPGGVALAKKRRLPPILIQFIKTHHGTTHVEYFYRKYLKENPDGTADISSFTYPGPKPSTREHAILMMADSIEAACKSIKNPTEQSLNKRIDMIIDRKVKLGQFTECALTFGEMETCRKIFKQVMKSVHHARIEYDQEGA